MTALFKEKQDRITRRPSWCSLDLWETLSGMMSNGELKAEFAFTASERKVYRRPKPIKPSVWAEKHRVLIKSRFPGKWKNEVTPYSVGIMDAIAKPYVREANIGKVPQSGLSEAINTFIGSRIDLSPGDVLYTFPDENTAKDNARDRIQPMIESSSRLKSFMTGNEKDLSSARINLQHMTIYFAWAGSESRLANRPIRYAVSDEIDKKGFGIGKKEAAPLDLIDKRLITYREISKHIKLSSFSDENGNINQELKNNTDVVFEYHVKCPYCGQRQLMDMEQIKWEGGRSADALEIKKKKLAWYECLNCSEKWDDNDRNQAVRATMHDGWVDTKTKIALDTYLEKFRPAYLGFLLPGWISPFISLSECVAAFIKGLESKKKLKDFLNGFAAQPWKKHKTIIHQKEDDILACRCDLPPHMVPESAVALTAGVDVQKIGFWYVVRAWAKDYTSWNIDHGHLGNWDDVERLLFEMAYPIQDSDCSMRIWRAGIDTGGGKYKETMSSTEETYLWLQDNSGLSRGCRVWGVKGSSKPLPTKIKMGSVLTKTPSGRPLKMGMRLVMVDPNKSKDMVFERMEKARGGLQGGAWLHSETSMDYALQMTAEKKLEDENGIESWVKIGSGDNHYIDCEYIAALVADWEWPGNGVNMLSYPVNIVKPVTKKKKVKKENPFTHGQQLFGA